MTERLIYLDCNATTPVRPEVLEVVVPEKEHNLHLQELVVMDHLMYMHMDQELR